LLLALRDVAGGDPRVVGFKVVQPDLSIVDALIPHLQRVFEAFRDTCGASEWRILPFEIERDGPSLVVRVLDDEFEGGAHVIHGHVSALMLLAGRYWAATAPDAAFRVYPAYLRDLGDARRVEEAARAALTEAALLFAAAGEREEASFVLRRALRGGDLAGLVGWRVGELVDPRVPAELREDVLRSPELAHSLAGETGRRVDRVLPIALARAGHLDALERATAAAAAEDIVRFGSGRSVRALADASTATLVVLTRDRVPFVAERALGALQRLADLLWSEAEWARLAPCLDPLIDAGVFVNEYLRRRTICRLAAGDDDAAAADWQRVEAIGTRGPISLGPGMGMGSLEDFWLSGVVRVAKRLSQQSDAQAQDRSRELLARVAPKIELRVSAQIERARAHAGAGEPNEPSSVFSELYDVLGHLAERVGDLDLALAAYHRGREYVSTTGDGRTAAFGPELERVRRCRLGLGWPPPLEDFEPDWLVDPARTDEETREAVSRWSRTAWRAFPSTAAAAAGTPLVAAMLRRFDVARAWPEARRYDRFLVIYERHTSLAVARPGRRLATWEWAFGHDGANRVAFALETAEQWQTYDAWLSQLEVLPPNEEAILAALPSEVFARISQRLESKGSCLDLERYLVDQIHQIGADPLAARRWLALCRRLRGEAGSEPSPTFEREATLAGGGPAVGRAYWAWVEILLGPKDRFEADRPDWLEPHFLWPLAYYWDPALEPSVVAAVQGALDPAPPQRAQRHSRAAAAAWLAARVGSQALVSAAEDLGERSRPRQRRPDKVKVPRRALPARPEDFFELLWESLERDFVAAATTGPRAAETCTRVVLSVCGLPETSTTHGFDGPHWALHRSGDGDATLALYERLRAAWRPGRRSRAWSTLVDEVAQLRDESQRTFVAWSLRALFTEEQEGQQDRSWIAEALGRRARGDQIDYKGLWLGQQVYGAAPERRARLIETYARVLRSGHGPALFQTLIGNFADRILVERPLERLRRSPRLEVVVVGVADRVREPSRERVLAYG
jgi:hypothetical protein